MLYQNKKCLVCNSKNLKEIKVKGLNLIKCKKCGLEWQKKFPTPKELNKIYSNYFQNKIDYSKNLFWKKIYSEYVKKIKPGKILDIGCGLGDFLQILKKNKWTIYGIDLNKKSVDESKKKLNTNRIFNKKIEDYSPKIKFKLITMFDLIEHVYKPDKILKKSYKILKKGGYILINTPDTSNWFKKVFGKNWFQYKEEHLYYFNKKSLILLLKKQGFKIMKIKNTKKILSLYLLMSHFKEYYTPLVSEFFNFLQKFIKNKISQKIYLNLPASEIIILAKKCI